MKNNFVKVLHDKYNEGYKQGCQDGGLYWTCLVVIALHNLYGWTKCIDRIEEEVGRLSREVYKYGEDKGQAVVKAVEQIRGKDYFKF